MPSTIVPTSVADHVAEERVGGDLEDEHVSLARPARVLNRPHEDPVLRLRSRERAKVVAAEQERRLRAQAPDVERARIPPAAARLERRADATPPDAIAIRPRARREPRVKVGRRLLGRDDGNVFGQRGVQRLGRALGAGAASHVDARHVRERMDAGVRAARDREPGRGRVDRVERLPQSLLDGAQARLRRQPGSRCRRRRALASAACQAALPSLVRSSLCSMSFANRLVHSTR